MLPGVSRTKIRKSDEWNWQWQPTDQVLAFSFYGTGEKVFGLEIEWHGHIYLIDCSTGQVIPMRKNSPPLPPLEK